MAALTFNTPYAMATGDNAKQLLPPGTLVTSPTWRGVWVINYKYERQWISPEAYGIYGYDARETIKITDSEMEQYPQGSGIDKISGPAIIEGPKNGASKLPKYLFIGVLVLGAGFLLWKYRGKFMKK